MFKPLLALGLVLGSLLVLVPHPTTGYTVKLLGKAGTFGEGHAEASEKKSKVPVADDTSSHPKRVINVTRENVVTSEEESLDHLTIGKPWTNLETDDYLIKYGYLRPPVNSSVSEDERKDAIKEFQRFSRLVESGVVDPRTKKQMQRPRCGLADPVQKSKLANFETDGVSKWSKKDLTYRILKYSMKLPRYKVRENVAKAFKMWADVSQLTFTEVYYGVPDIAVKFTPRRHGDGYPFDGRGGVLAHAFYPEDGQVHLEEEENWTIKSKEGTNLLYVLVHEIGHALGLGHSKSKNAIMEPVYIGYRPNLALERDDIAGIQFLYGRPKRVPTKPKPPTKAPVTKAPVTKAPVTKAPVKPTEPSPRAHRFPCPFYFGALMTAGGKTYGFSRYFIHEIHLDGSSSRLRLTTSVFQGGPSTVEAAAHDEVTGQTFLFNVNKVWRFTNHKLDEGFPKRLPMFIRTATMVNNQLLAFSFTHIHILDQDTMEDYVDGEVTIRNEYPKLPLFMNAAISYRDDLVYVVYTNKVIQLDTNTGEIGPPKYCSAK